MFFAEAGPGMMKNLYFETSAIIITLILLEANTWKQWPRQNFEAIRKLAALQAKTAWVIRDSQEMDIPIEESRNRGFGDCKAGGKGPGGWHNRGGGHSSLDESMVTGKACRWTSRQERWYLEPPLTNSGTFKIKPPG